MTTRILPRAEYRRLVGTELETVAADLPADATVLVVERDSVIVGCWATWQETHVEGVWIAPEARGRGPVARRLLTAMRSFLRGRGVTRVLTAATTEDVRGILAHLGATQLPGDHFVMGIR